jgi:multidrug resistance efflux pump
MPDAALQDPESEALAVASEPALKPAAKPRSRPSSPRRKKTVVETSALPPPAPVAAAPIEAMTAAADPVPAHAALALYAQILAAASPQAAAHRVVATLSNEGGFSRAAIGLVDGRGVRLLAISDTDLGQAAAEWTQRLLGCMQEAVEQSVSLSWPRAGGLPAADDSIALEHQLLQRHVGGAVASVPLGAGGETFAVVCVERQAGPPFEARELARLEQMLALAAPALRWMDRAAQPWHRRTASALVQAWAALRQPERRTARRMMAAAAAALAFVALAPLEQDVSGRARVEGAEQRALTAPADGFVKAVHVRPGDRVLAGAPLLDLLDGDLRLERERWSSQLAQHENAYAAAMAKPDRAAASTSLARISEAQSQLALVDDQLARGRVVAPFDALVIQGDLSQSIGAPVRQGDTLLTLATTGQQRVIVDVDEVDIAQVQVGQPGRLSLSSLAWGSEAIVVERITPLARAVEGRNVFEVEARLVEPRADLRPGLLGRAELVVGRRPPLWTWTAQALDRLRLAWWSWLG